MVVLFLDTRYVIILENKKHGSNWKFKDSLDKFTPYNIEEKLKQLLTYN